MNTKFILSFVLITLGYLACKEENKKTDSTTQQTVGTNVTTDNANNPLYQKGVALIANSDCLTCHKLKEKLIGPSYLDIANKYPNDEEHINDLVNKIIKGSKGVWGQIPMTPHPQLSKEDATTMVNYIFLLKK